MRTPDMHGTITACDVTQRVYFVGVTNVMSREVVLCVCESHVTVAECNVTEGGCFV